MALQDGLACLRRAVAAKTEPYPIASPDPASPPCPLPAATHLFFPPGTDSTAPGGGPAFTLPLDAPTRFESSAGGAVDLRSVFFAWVNRDLAIPDYLSTIQTVNDQLGDRGRIQNLVFVERLELANWLSNVTAVSEHVRPLGGDGKSGGRAGAGADQSGIGATDDPVLAEIYAAERSMLDHNTVLRGPKPMDHSSARQYSQAFLTAALEPARPPNGVLMPSARKKGNQRMEPIILLSPSASSILRMSNIKQFLESGSFVPADSAAAGTSSSATILHISRLLPSIDPVRPIRFILVDNPDQFKPEYWGRLVAVFTTGQSWQFKSYKWPNPAELFARVMGLYVGWTGDKVPDNVVGWGRNVRSYTVDKWSPVQADKGRWRDREVVESCWAALEENMKVRGWSKNGPGTGPA